MSKKEYLNRLEILLSDLPEEERRAAMEYYIDYLEDAGPEGEQEAMEHLGSPEIVAAAVREGIQNDGTQGNWTEKGYETGTGNRDFYSVQPRTQRRQSKGQRRRRRGIGWGILLILGLLCFGLPFLAVLGSIVLTAAAAVAGVSLGGFGVALALAVAGIVLIAVGISKIYVLPGMGVVLVGGGFICLSLAILALIGAIWLFRKVVPWLFRGMGWVINRMFGRGGGRE